VPRVLRQLLRRRALPVILAGAVMTGCEDSGPAAPVDPPVPADSPDEVHWVQATITPFVLVHSGGAVLVTVSDPLLSGRYEAELYLESDDGAWSVATPFWDENWHNWFLTLQPADGSVSFRYPQWWSSGTFRVRIAVRRPRAAVASLMVANSALHAPVAGVGRR